MNSLNVITFFSVGGKVLSVSGEMKGSGNHLKSIWSVGALGIFDFSIILEFERKKST